MNNRLLNTALLIASSSLFLAGCSEDNSSFETPNTSGTPANDSPVSQNNFTLLFSPVNPQFLDPATGTFTAVTSEVSVQIGDNDNQVVTGSRVINFRTEWGLIDPSCTTVDGTCSVTWRSGSPDSMPANLFNTIVAYSVGGQESFGDLNGNGIFDDGDAFNTAVYADVEEPYINVDESGFINTNNGFVSTFTSGDIIIDTINGVDLTGANATHDAGDGLFNGPNCAHSSLCSTTQSTITVWEDGTQVLNGGTIFSVGGSITGLGGSEELVILNNSGNELTLTSADTTYAYSILGGTEYAITVKTDPVGKTCVIANNTATPIADVTDANITCTP